MEPHRQLRRILATGQLNKADTTITIGTKDLAKCLRNAAELEREACAQVVERRFEGVIDEPHALRNAMAHAVRLIRARGQG